MFVEGMRAVIPFKRRHAKSRLSPLLSEKEREEFAFAMLRDVIEALTTSGCFDVIDVLSTSIIDVNNANVVLTQKGLNEALNEYLQKMESHSIQQAVMIIMADIPLVSPDNIKDIVSSPADIVIAPGRMGGTNVLFIKHPSRFNVDYYGASFLKHCDIASRNRLRLEVFDSFNLSTDIDEIQDLAELLIHGKGYAAEYLRNKGFSIVIKEGRVGVKRE